MGCKNAFIAGAVSGTLFGIFLITGQDVSPENIAIQVGDQVNNALKGVTTNPSLWDQYRPWLLLLGFFSTIATIISIIKEGSIVIIVALLGFFGMLFLLLITKFQFFGYLGIVLLIIAAIMVRLCLKNLKKSF
jgi:hypothetical protein